MSDNLVLTTKFNIFHGSVELAIDSILKEKHFHIEKRNDHWLGNGIYFYIDDISKAFWWATNARVKREKERKSQKKMQLKEEEAIVLFEIVIERNNLIDLDTEQDRAKINEFVRELEGLGTKLTFKEKKNEEQEKKEALCSLIDMYVNYHENIDAVKYTFKSEKRIYKKLEKNYGIDNNGVQLSLFNQSLLDFENCVKKKRSEWNVG